jgi:hypothetical protein
MANNSEFESSLNRYAHVYLADVHIVPLVTSAELSAIKKGILFIHAPWSEASVRSLVTLASTLASLPGPRLPLYIADIASWSPLLGMESFAGMLCGGFGETFWMKDGQVVGKMSAYGEVDKPKLLQQTRNLDDNCVGGKS